MAKRKEQTVADYDKIIAEAFRRLRTKYGKGDQYPFEKQLLEDVARDLLDKRVIEPIRNIPDIKYTYDARKPFPREIAATGFWAITGRGKGKYTFERIEQDNLIRIPDDLKLKYSLTTLKDITPPAVAAVLGDDVGDYQETRQFEPDARNARGGFGSIAIAWGV
ncbi:MAG: hypothetical protein M0T84_13150 [Betaproteobacteria bacterium]|nr:hypothetical protein [Betaproteobacteria bacterium]